MFQNAGVIAEFVFSQLPSPRDTLAIIDGLQQELPDSAWAKAGLWPEHLVSEMRRQSYQENSSTSLADCLDIIMDRTVPLTAKRQRGMNDRAAREQQIHAALVQKLKQDCEEYAVKAIKVGEEWHTLLLKTGLPLDACNRVMSFVLLRAHRPVARGPRTYCMRCKQWYPLYQFVLHVAESEAHLAVWNR
jgi:hypothetical protein